ncbi:MAG TPA: RdgB/HAM1 family non-canonical purine NTP pyrophosphatase [Dehalococcoidia bacterium]|nr:RdgB/HAM1 family non-canonical purine NTP pyrophosphatase [Dehalococcoidia bacterium]
MPPTLLLATNNAGKQREFRELLADCGWELVVPAALRITLDAEENGRTYAENATIKAVAAAKAAKIPALADDSGLEVDALHGAPGLFSERYAGPGATDADRRAKLLRELERVPEPSRTARFRCAIAIAVPEGSAVHVSVHEGEVQGVILMHERGEGGFGYDPLFLIPELGRTMAELRPEEKNEVSHRGRAARSACIELRSIAAPLDR